MSVKITLLNGSTAIARILGRRNNTLRVLYRGNVYPVPVSQLVKIG